MARTKGGLPAFNAKKNPEAEKNEVQVSADSLKDQMLVQCDFFNAKVSQYCYYEANMQRIRIKLSETQKNILRRESSIAKVALDHEHTFWCKQMIHSVLLRQLKEDEDSKKDGSLNFNFAGKKVKFGRTEFAVITGLKMGDFPSEFAKFATPDGPSLISPYLTGEGRHFETTYADVFKAFDQINSSYSDEVVVSLTILLLYTSIIGEQKRNRIDGKVVHLSCNWQSFDQIPWGEVSYKLTVDSARKAMANALKQSRDRDNRTYTVGGFPVALGVFAYELMPHFDRFHLVEKVKTEGCRPRMHKWQALKSSRTSMEKNKVWSKILISGESVQVTPITPTADEFDKFLGWEEKAEQLEFSDEELPKKEEPQQQQPSVEQHDNSQVNQRLDRLEQKFLELEAKVDLLTATVHEFMRGKEAKVDGATSLEVDLFAKVAVTTTSYEGKTPSVPILVEMETPPPTPIKDKANKDRGVGELDVFDGLNLGPLLSCEKHTSTQSTTTPARFDIEHFKPAPEDFEDMLQWLQSKKRQFLWTPLFSLDSDMLKNVVIQNEWLSNEHLDLYTSMLRKRILTIGRKDISIMETFFDTGMKTLFKSKQDPTYDDLALKQFVGSVPYEIDCRAADQVLFPVHIDGNHWILVRMDLHQHQFHVYNSLYQAGIGPKLEYLVKTMPKILNVCELPSMDQWKVVIEQGLPQQEASGGACGIFVLKWAECLIHGVPPETFNPTPNSVMDARTNVAAAIFVHARQEDQLRLQSAKRARI